MPVAYTTGITGQRDSAIGLHVRKVCMDILGLRSGRADANLPASSAYCEALSYLTLAFLIAFTPFIKGPTNYLHYTLRHPFGKPPPLPLASQGYSSWHPKDIRLRPLTVTPIIFLFVIAASSSLHHQPIGDEIRPPDDGKLHHHLASSLPQQLRGDRLWRGLLLSGGHRFDPPLPIRHHAVPYPYTGNYSG